MLPVIYLQQHFFIKLRFGRSRNHAAFQQIEAYTKMKASTRYLPSILDDCESESSSSTTNLSFSFFSLIVETTAEQGVFYYTTRGRVDSVRENHNNDNLGSNKQREKALIGRQRKGRVTGTAPRFKVTNSIITQLDRVLVVLNTIHHIVAPIRGGAAHSVAAPQVVNYVCG